MLKAFQKTISIFILLFILTFPFPYTVFPNIGGLMSPFFELIIKWAGDNIFKIQTPYTVFLSSDSTGLYIHTFLLCVFSAILGIFWHFKSSENAKKILNFIYVFCRYYLALQMFIYGFNKVFKWQFYMPEPNTLLTKLGDVSPDLLYWSTMGLSRPYTIFAGLMEVVPALLLLFRRTQLLGAILSFLVLLNVWAINVSFDISVKLYSSFLLVLTAYLIAPYLKNLIDFFQGKPTFLKEQDILWKPFQNKKWNLFSKTMVIVFFMVEIFWQYVETGNFNDDKAQRPYLHGAYQVQYVVKNKDTFSFPHKEAWKYFFIHRRGYFIIQYSNENMQDYKLSTDSSVNTFNLLDELKKEKIVLNFQIHNHKNIEIFGIWGKDTISVKAQKIDIHRMPALQREFHWRVDE
jgi:hypothetical protein